MKKVLIEWHYFSKNGKTCDRCQGTKNNLDSAIKELRSELKPKGIGLDFIKKELPKNQISESNIILIDGIPIEKIIPNTNKGESECCSCGDLCGKPTDCRTVNQNGLVFEEIPTALIKEAVLRKLKLFS